MNWFKQLFGIGDKMETDYNGLPLVKDFFPMPEVKPCKPEKNISEPVYAIVEAMQKYPSRFKVKFNEELSKNREVTIYCVTDIKTKQKVTCSTFYFYGRKYKFSWDWLTDDEMKFLGEEGLKMYEKKLDRKKAFQRAKMKGIYS